MTFLQWTFLLGSFAIAGPIIAHLLAKPRFKRIPFTMLQFLKTGQKESHSRRKLRDILILILRCSIIILLAILFAQPILFVKAEPRAQRLVYYLALDDSMSMSYIEDGSSLFSRMVEKAREYIKDAPESSIFNYYALASGRSANDIRKSQLLQEISRLETVPKQAKLADFFSALKMAARTASVDDYINVILMSDFSPSILTEFKQIQQPAYIDNIIYESFTASDPVNNVAILAANISDITDNYLNIDVSVANYGSVRQKRILTARTLNLEPVSIEIEISPMQYSIFRGQLNLGLRHTWGGYLPIEIILSPNDNLKSDDIFFLSAYLPHEENTNVLLVYDDKESFLFETAVNTISELSQINKINLKKVTHTSLQLQDLSWADITVFTQLPKSTNCRPNTIKNYTTKGGQIIIFASQDDIPDISQQLWKQDLLPAFPEKWIDEITYLQPTSCLPTFSGLDNKAERKLTNYNIEQIAVKGAWDCKVAPQAKCIWRFSNGIGFIYGMYLEQGFCIFVNTSIDDSLGLLAKSNAWVAFCRYLLGNVDRIQQFCYTTSDKPVLHMPDVNPNSQVTSSIWIENSDGRKTYAPTHGNLLYMPIPAGTGWMKTTDSPVIYAGINLPEGETDLRIASTNTIDDTIKRTFVTDPSKRQTVRYAGPDYSRKLIWKYCAWIAVFLILSEALIANRLKR